MYAFYDGLAEAAPPAALRRGGPCREGVWERVNGDGRVARLLLGRVTIPAAVAALNRLGLGPLRPELTGEELRRAGLAAMGRVADVLAPDARHVLFGHTHRPGPLGGDDCADWRTPAGARLWNTGTWLHEVSFVPNPDRRNPIGPERSYGSTTRANPARERIGGVAGVTQLVAVERHVGRLWAQQERVRVAARREPDIGAAGLGDRVAGRRGSGSVAVCGSQAPHAGQLPPPGTRSLLHRRVSHSLQDQVYIATFCGCGRKRISSCGPLRSRPRMDVICIGGRKLKGGDTERVADLWD